MRLHHVAIRVDDIQKAVDWYTETLSASISYQDNSWALLEVENTFLALVLPEQHPSHIAFETLEAEKFGDLTPHRDGTASVYVNDPFGNTVEFLRATESAR